MERAIEILTQHPLFHGVPAAAFEPYLVRISLRIIVKGEILEIEGDPAQDIGIVVKGQLAKQKYSSDGSFVMIDLLGAGDAYGEDLIFSHHKDQVLAIEAITNGEILSVPRLIVKDLMAAYPVVKDNFLYYLSETIHQQHRRVLVLSQRNLRQKISSYLMDLLEEQVRAEEENADPNLSPAERRRLRRRYVTTDSVELPVSKEVAARLLAMPRPSFSRELVRMEKDGLIRSSGRVVWLLDPEALEYGESDDDDEF